MESNAQFVETLEKIMEGRRVLEKHKDRSKKLLILEKEYQKMRRRYSNAYFSGSDYNIGSSFIDFHDKQSTKNTREMLIYGALFGQILK